MMFTYSKHVQTNLIGKFDLFDQVAQTIRRTDARLASSYAAAKLSMPICIRVSPNFVIITPFLSAPKGEPRIVRIIV